MTVGVTWNLLTRPGMTSIFMRNDGTPKLWMTSGECRLNWTVWSTGSTSVGICEAVPDVYGVWPPSPCSV